MRTTLFGIRADLNRCDASSKMETLEGAPADARSAETIRLLPLPILRPTEARSRRRTRLQARSLLF